MDSDYDLFYDVEEQYEFDEYTKIAFHNKNTKKQILPRYEFASAHWSEEKYKTQHIKKIHYSGTLIFIVSIWFILRL
jgi:hypothetical protein